MFFRSSLFFLFLAGAVSALAGTFTVDSAADQALKRNPTLAAARLRIEEARGRLLQSGRLSNPDLDLEFTRNTASREGSVGVAIMQRFPLTARLRFEKAVSRAELSAAEAEVRDADRKLAAEVRTRVVKLLALAAQRDLRAKQLAHSRDLSGFLGKRVETGEASTVDASQVDLETRQIEIENLQLAAEEVALVGELRPLLGVPVGVEIKVAGRLSAFSSPAGQAGGGSRADVQAAEARVVAADAAVQQQRASRWQDIGVGGMFSREREKDEPDPIETEHFVGLKVSIPLPLWNRNEGRIREAEAAAARAAQELEAARQTASAEAAAALAEMESLSSLIARLDGAVLPKAAEIEEQLRQSYTGGLVPLTDVLRARTRGLELQRSRIDAQRDYELARIRYKTATATTATTMVSKGGAAK